MILTGDIGGTKTNLACFAVENGKLSRGPVKSYPSKQYSSLTLILKSFQQEMSATIDMASFGIAGPVVNGRCTATNLPWIVDAKDIASAFGLKRAELINDLEATAYGTLRLQENDKLMLNAGMQQPHGAIAVIAAGTGLGEGGLVWTGSRYQALPSEGGHTDFAPRNETEIELLRFLLKKYKRVSYERVISGMGIENLYQFFRTQVGYTEPAWLADEIASGDPAAAISSAGIAGKDEACVKAMELFVSLYAAEAANLGLKLLSTGGLFIGGGIAPKILPLLQQSTFIDSFTSKGRLSGVLKNMPVHVILNDTIALYGAAHYALTMNE
ncbi:MAG: glucokinase [Bacteroidetes bacterium]|nr:glucokinase [Bacteroidota bacterium]MCW5894759.1 glucokinase [Bacteroidota bacterium]